ncbi:MAG: GyrI-like domain-containing protein [Gemmatimonadales bacterium]
MTGLAVRTTNAEEMDPAKARIPGLWGLFMALERPRAAGPVLAVYSAYESGVTGSYQILIGHEVTGPSSVAQLQVVDVPGGEYLVFDCPGPLPGAVIDGWRQVWKFFAQPGAPARAYTADFEIYLGQERTEIWVAVQ